MKWGCWGVFILFFTTFYFNHRDDFLLSPLFFSFFLLAFFAAIFVPYAFCLVPTYLPTAFLEDRLDCFFCFVSKGVLPQAPLLRYSSFPMCVCVLLYTFAISNCLFVSFCAGFVGFVLLVMVVIVLLVFMVFL